MTDASFLDAESARRALNGKNPVTMTTIAIGGAIRFLEREIANDVDFGDADVNGVLVNLRSERDARIRALNVEKLESTGKAGPRTLSQITSNHSGRTKTLSQTMADHNERAREHTRQIKEKGDEYAARIKAIESGAIATNKEIVELKASINTLISQLDRVIDVLSSVASGTPVRIVDKTETKS